MTWLLGLGFKLLSVGKWLRELPWQAWAAIAALAVIAFGVWQHGKATDRAYNEAFNSGYMARVRHDEPKFLIQQRSIETLTKAVNRQNVESLKRAAAFDASKAIDAENVARANRDAKATDTRIAVIRGIGERAAMTDGCVAPEALLREMEGL